MNPQEAALAQLDEINGIDSVQTPVGQDTPAITPEEPNSSNEPGPNDSVLDQLEMDEPLFENGPTRSQTEELKKKYPNSQIYALMLADNSGILYRTITRGEWKQLVAEMKTVEEQDKREEIIFSKISLFPDCSDLAKINDLPAGAVTSVMNEFYTLCGFTPLGASVRL